MAHLQPYLVFAAETKRINDLYWSSKYSFERTIGILNLISDTGQHPLDPRVEALWSSNEAGQNGMASMPLSNFTSMLHGNSEALRTASILNICSAFENALCGYYSICALYQPKIADPLCTSLPIPSLLQSAVNYYARKTEVFNACESRLHGKYTKRVKLITGTWGLPAITAPGKAYIDGYYKKRHQIAHDQGMSNADAPEQSSMELLASRISMTETSWKKLLSDFSSVLVELDRSVSQYVATDGGLALAIFRIIERDGTQNLTDLSQKLSNEWRLGNVKKSRVTTAATTIGLKVKQVKANIYTVGR